MEVGMSDDEARLKVDLGRELPILDLDEARAKQIAVQTRQQVGRGPSPRRFVEPVLVGVLAISLIGWVVVKLVEILG
jgi:hypothetical protein